MEGSFQGDLLDILRSTGVAGGGRSAAELPLPPPVDHQLISGGGFGDPFLTMRDPLLAELPAPATVAEEKDGGRSGFQITTSSGGGGGGVVVKNPSTARSSSSSPSSCFVESNRVQISAPRNPIIKRRKSQAKKVVCIPAPTTANSRQGGGEVVPSDLWAWRKYGQKPIKGSPFPRGYYRCSSSKGCSARKQVERSRTDPNMLVITYTSEHNHPWPTQRNALAGSTRITSTAPTSPSDPSPPPPPHATTVVGETRDHQQTLINATSNDAGPEPEDQTNQNHSSMNQIVFDYDKSYRPVVQDECGDDFFADLRELETNPLDMMFTGFAGEGGEKDESKPVLDPFSGLFDWTSNTTTSTTSNGDRKSS